MTLGEIIRRILFRLRGKVIHFSPMGPTRGNVLISYITLSLFNKTERTLNAHTNRWESIDMAEAFRERGYSVDMIDITNTTFVPRKKYDFFIDNYHNMERLAPLLPGTKKVFFASTAHWKFNNDAEQKRFDNLFARRGVQLSPDRAMPPNRALETCDEVALLGNTFTSATYSYANKPTTALPISTTHEFESPENKNFEQIRKNFIWFGGAGVIHKGLDLVVEAFAQMPEYSLTICGKLDGEIEFKKIYEQELSLPNIHIAGFMDPGSTNFKTLCEQSLGLVYPSCSEGQAGSVVLTMHAGLLPIISFQSGVDVGNFGIILKENTVGEIKKAVESVAALPASELKERAVAAWSYARTHHTRASFSKAFRAYVDRLLELQPVS